MNHVGSSLEVRSAETEFSIRDVDNFLRLGGLKVKTKELQFSSRGEGAGGGYAPSYTKCRSKNFFQNPRGVREQIRVIFK